MSDDMVRCSACGTPHGSIEDATVCCEKDKPGVVGLEVTPRTSGDGMIYEFNLRLWNYSTLSGTLYVFSRGADE